MAKPRQETERKNGTETYPLWGKFLDKILEGIGNAAVSAGEFYGATSLFRIDKEEAKQILSFLKKKGIIKIKKKSVFNHDKDIIELNPKFKLKGGEKDSGKDKDKGHKGRERQRRPLQDCDH